MCPRKGRRGGAARYILFFWALPLGFFWGWYYLSLMDVGERMLTREANRLVFEFYGNILGIEPATLPALMAQGCLIDSLIIFAFFAFRQRRAVCKRLAERGYRWMWARSA